MELFYPPTRALGYASGDQQLRKLFQQDYLLMKVEPRGSNYIECTLGGRKTSLCSKARFVASRRLDQSDHMYFYPCFMGRITILISIFALAAIIKKYIQQNKEPTESNDYKPRSENNTLKLIDITHPHLLSHSFLPATVFCIISRSIK